jgi:hypothetical protein
MPPYEKTENTKGLLFSPRREVAKKETEWRVFSWRLRVLARGEVSLEV